MKLYFQAGKKYRIAIDTEKHTFNTDYYYLGEYKDYIKISVSDGKKILQEIAFNAFNYDERF